MKTYKTNGDGKFEIEVSEPTSTPVKQPEVVTDMLLQDILAVKSSPVKVRVTHVMPWASDVNIFNGEPSTAYPFVIGHSAIGVISDDRDEYGLKRGTKVILDPYVSNNVNGEVSELGLDTDGFLREFAFVERDNIIEFPENLSESEAVLTEKVALALKALNSFDLEKGDYIVIVGGDAVCNLIGQLAIYFQMVPIMIDSNAENLARAEQCGIYYTINETKESAIEKVKEITCGRMAECSIVSMKPELTPAFVFPMTKVGGKCVIMCENKTVKLFEADVSAISRRQLTVKGINNADGEVNSAVNILAQKILKLGGFIDKTVEIKDADVLLRELKTTPERYFNPVIRV